MSNRIDRAPPPAIPQAPQDYRYQYVDQTNSIFRLFFNRINAVFSTLLSNENGANVLYFPRGLFYDTTRQQAGIANTAYAVTYNTTYMGDGVSVASSSRVTVAADGVYNFNFSAQVDKHGGVLETLWLWIRKNGVDVAPSARQYGVVRPTPVDWSFNIDMKAGDYIEMMWAVDNTDLDIHGYAASAPHPGIPSAVMAVSFVSNV